MTNPLLPASPAVQMFHDGRMDVTNASAYLGLTPKTLAMKRCHGNGPPFIKLGKAVFYRRDDLDSWIASRRVTSTAQARVKQIKAVA